MADNLPKSLTILRGVASVSPYPAVLVGMHVFKNAWLTIGLYHGFMILSLAATALTRGYSFLPENLLTGWRARTGLPQVIFGLGAGVAIYMVWPFVGNEQLASTLASLGLGGVSWALFAVYYSLVNPILEEAFWRGASLPLSTTPTIEDALFAGYHGLVLIIFVPWFFVLPCVGALFGAAWMWRQTTISSGGLAQCVAGHVAADISIALAATAIVLI